jgi:hypothetical protein
VKSSETSRLIRFLAYELGLYSARVCRHQQPPFWRWAAMIHAMSTHVDAGEKTRRTHVYASPQPSKRQLRRRREICEINDDVEKVGDLVQRLSKVSGCARLLSDLCSPGRRDRPEDHGPPVPAVRQSCRKSFCHSMRVANQHAEPCRDRSADGNSLGSPDPRKTPQQHSRYFFPDCVA